MLDTRLPGARATAWACCSGAVRGRAAPRARRRDGRAGAGRPRALGGQLRDLREHRRRCADAYDEIAAAYDEIGATWTVWVRHGDRATAALLPSAGTCSTPSPRRWRARSTTRPRAPSSSWTGRARATCATSARLNDLAYELRARLVRARAGRPVAERGAVYVARDDGEPVGGLVMADQRRQLRPGVGGGGPRGARSRAVGQADRPRPGRRRRARPADHHAGLHQARPAGLRAARLPAAGRSRDVGAAPLSARRRSPRT